MVSAGIVSGKRALSKAEIEDQARRVANGLAALGIRQGDCVAILMRNDIAFLTATYGANVLGAYAVPINWHFSAEEIAYVLADSGAKVLIGHTDLLYPLAVDSQIRVLWVATPPEILASVKVDATHLDVPEGAIRFEAWVAEQQPYPGKPLHQLQSMIYTSGTTGRPKGVRRNAPTPIESVKTEEMRTLVYGAGARSRGLLPGPLYHSAPNSFGMRTGRLGDALVLMPRFDAEDLLRLIERERIDTIFMVPIMFIRLLKLPDAVRRRYDISSLRFVSHAGAPCPVDVKKAMLDWWGPILWEFYGGTETGPVTLASSRDALLKPGTVGRAPSGVELRILNDAGHSLPAGEIGEVFAKFDGLPDFTYHNLPEKRAEIAKNGLITCGDVGYLDQDGYLFLCDRKRDVVISGGVNIYPAEIEAVLLALPGVQDCAVFGVPDPEFGEALMAIVEPMPGMVLEPGTLRTQLARRIASYKVPGRIEFRRDFPRDDAGKISKRRLRDPYWKDVGRKI